MFAASAAYGRDFLASGAIWEVPVARRESDGVKRLAETKKVRGKWFGCRKRETNSAELTFGDID